MKLLLYSVFLKNDYSFSTAHRQMSLASSKLYNRDLQWTDFG